MNREILYKAKRKDNGEWIEGFYIPIGKRAYIICEAELDCADGENTDLYATEWYEINPETVCQYTGLTDKNGRKIFEGDIAKDSSCELYTINWSDENGMYEIRQYDCSMASFETFFACDCEVIGNIFDNPELLEEKV